MYKIVLTLSIMIAIFTGCSAKEEAVVAPKQTKSKMTMFQSVPVEKATLLQEGKQKAYCPNCGMNLPMFYKSNHAATVNGKTKQYCSLHCLSQDLLAGKALKNIKVVDANSLRFIDATKAFYVIKSNKKGTMSPISKYAFATKKEAEAFAKENGGKVGDFQMALGVAKKDFTPEIQAKMKAKKMMMAKKGEKIYKMKCKQETLPKFHSVSQAKAYITEHALCGNLSAKPLQALGIYLFTK